MSGRGCFELQVLTALRLALQANSSGIQAHWPGQWHVVCGVSSTIHIHTYMQMAEYLHVQYLISTYTIYISDLVSYIQYDI
jgi:hypothetical protein